MLIIMEGSSGILYALFRLLFVSPNAEFYIINIHSKKHRKITFMFFSIKNTYICGLKK